MIFFYTPQYRTFMAQPYHILAANVVRRVILYLNI